MGFALLGLLCLMVLFGALRFISEWQGRVAKAYSSAVVEGFGSAMIAYRNYYGKYPVAMWGDMFRVLQGEDINGQNRSNVIFLAPDPRKKTPWIVDGWERSLSFSIGSNVVRVWSVGANGKDEFGRGDDIVVEKQ